MRKSYYIHSVSIPYNYFIYHHILIIETLFIIDSFKAAAAYFLLMVLSIIYTLNQDLALDLYQWFLYIRHHTLKAYQKYLRGGYVDIPDSLSVSPILPVFMDDIVDFDDRRSQKGENRDPLRKAHSLSSLELRSRRSGTTYVRVSRSKDKEK